MSLLKATLMSCAFMIFTGCGHYSPIKGKVIDSTTGKPIEGALIVAQWTKKHGFGLTYHTLSLITETVTDSEGVFEIKKTPNDIFVEPPEMIIYKEGYIPWRNDSIFPSCDLVKKNEWKNNVIYKLDVFTNKYTARQLWEFLDTGIIGWGGVPIFHKIDNEISSRKVDEDRKNKSMNQ